MEKKLTNTCEGPSSNSKAHYKTEIEPHNYKMPSIPPHLTSTLLKEFLLPSISWLVTEKKLQVTKKAKNKIGRDRASKPDSYMTGTYNNSIPEPSRI